MGSQRKVKRIRRRLFRRIARLSFRCKIFGMFFLMWFVLYLRITKVEADTFYPEADGTDCDFAYAESLTVSSLPATDVVGYNVSQLVGIVDSDWISTHTLDSIATISYPYSQRDIGIKDRVAVPPGSVVDIGMFVYNHSGHRVEVKRGYLFLSKNDGTGDFSKLGADGYTDTDVIFTLRGHDMVKDGKVVELGNLGSYNNHHYPGSLAKGIKIYSFEVEQPLRFVSQNIDYSFNSKKELLVEIKVEVENVSPYNLNNIFYKHRDFSRIESFASNEVKMYEYEFNLGNSYNSSVNLGNIFIEDPNTQTECIVEGRDWSDRGYNPDHWTLILARTDANASTGWTGNQGEWPTRPSGDSMCVTRIPYSFQSEEVRLDLDSELNLETFLSSGKYENLKKLEVNLDNIFEVDLNLTNTGARANNVKICTDYNPGLMEILDSCGGEVLDNQIIWTLNSVDYDTIWDCSVVYKVVNFANDLAGEYELLTKAGEDSCLDGIEDRNLINFYPIPKIEVNKTTSDIVIQKGDEFCIDRNIVNYGNDTLEDVLLESECDNCEGIELVKRKSSGLQIGEIGNIEVGNFDLQECYEVYKEFDEVDLSQCLLVRESDGGIVYKDCVQLLNDKGNGVGNVVYDLLSGGNSILENSLESLQVEFNSNDLISVNEEDNDFKSIGLDDNLEVLVRAGGDSIFLKILISVIMICFVTIIFIKGDFIVIEES